jgi:spermidine/putrescine transport system permease protein
MSIRERIKSVFSSEFSFFMAAPALVWQIVLGLVPLGLIIGSSFIDLGSWTVTLRYYASLINWAHVVMMWWSFSLALITAVSCLFIGYPLAYWLARKVKVFKNLFVFFLIIPFWTNLLVLVYSWIFILERHGILNTFLLKIGIISDPIPLLNTMIAVLIVTMYCYVPFMVLPIFSSLEKIDPCILEASADLGGTYWKTFFKIILPMSWYGVRTGLLLVFVPVFGEFAIPLLMGGDKYMFVGNMIAHYVFMAFDVSSGAAFTIVAGILLVISTAVVSWFAKRLIYKV